MKRLLLHGVIFTLIGCTQNEAGSNDGQHTNEVQNERVASKSGDQWIETTLNIEVNGEKHQFDVQYFDDSNSGLTVQNKTNITKDNLENPHMLNVALWQHQDNLAVDFSNGEMSFSCIETKWKRSESMLSGSGVLSNSDKYDPKSDVPFSFEMSLK